MLAQIQKVYPEDVRVIYRHFPLPGHDKSLLSAQATEAAGKQGKFWEMHDLLFARQGEWGLVSPTDFETWVKTAAGGIGLDVEQFTADLTSAEIVKKVSDARAEAMQIGLPGTPFLLVNKQIYQGPRDETSLGNMVKLLLLQDKQVTGCPPITINPQKQYSATLQTAKGTIVIQLYADKAPVTVNSFVFLAKRGYFDQIDFFRVIENFAAETGDPSGTGNGGPGYTLKDEIASALNFSQPGVVAMANSGPGTNGSQFFITLTSQPSLNGKYTIFGQVIQGMETVRQLTLRDPSVTTKLPPADIIQSVTITEK